MMSPKICDFIVQLDPILGCLCLPGEFLRASGFSHGHVGCNGIL